tara:strand:- start:855 stop:1022 length:168 start_codon:yes stop_codon:yes gene_type:complete
MVPEKLTFSPLSRRQIEADFSGGNITSDAAYSGNQITLSHGYASKLHSRHINNIK